MYQISTDGLYLRIDGDSDTIFIPYVADLIYHVFEEDLDGYNVLLKDSTLFSKE